VERLTWAAAQLPASPVPIPVRYMTGRTHQSEETVIVFLFPSQARSTARCQELHHDNSRHRGPPLAPLTSRSSSPSIWVHWKRSLTRFAPDMSVSISDASRPLPAMKWWCRPCLDLQSFVEHRMATLMPIPPLNLSESLPVSHYYLKSPPTDLRLAADADHPGVRG
jgi:hypothetical protein